MRVLAGFLALVFCISLVATSAPGVAGEIELDDNLNAKLAKAKSKKRQEERQRSARNTEEDDETEEPDTNCGEISIGNVSGGRIGAVPRNNTVIITGDVINMDNKCGR